jgi:hypothetical protein
MTSFAKTPKGDAVKKLWFVLVPPLCALALTACPTNDPIVIITDAQDKIVLNADTVNVNVPNDAANPFVLKSLPSNPPSGVSITSYQWSAQLDAGGGCNGGAAAVIGTQQNLSWVVGFNTLIGGCYVQGSNTAKIKIAVTYSNGKTATNTAKIVFIAPPN